jgi:hypothetical protein
VGNQFASLLILSPFDVVSYKVALQDQVLAAEIPVSAPSDLVEAGSQGIVSDTDQINR